MSASGEWDVPCRFDLVCVRDAGATFELIITAMSLTSPKLWVVATPLGNPGDLSPRAREVLEGADMVLAEDTRRAGLLCQRVGVKAGGSCELSHDHNEESKLTKCWAC